MVSVRWLAQSWDETAGLTDFLAKIHLRGFGGNFLASTNSAIPEFTSVQFELYPNPQKRPRKFRAPVDIQSPPSDLISHARLFYQCP